MTPWLDRNDLFVLTKKRQNKAIVRVLKRMHIDCIERKEDGFPLVSRAQFERVKGYNRRRTPNWAALDGV